MAFPTKARLRLSVHVTVRALGDAKRISIPFFVEAAYDSLVDCLPSTVSTGTPCKYEPIKYGPYIHSTFKMFKEYANRGE